jgi:hypothetical protein
MRKHVDFQAKYIPYIIEAKVPTKHMQRTFAASKVEDINGMKSI